MSRLSAFSRMPRFLSGSLRIRPADSIRWRSDDCDKFLRPKSSRNANRRRRKFNVDNFEGQAYDLYVHTERKSKAATTSDLKIRSSELPDEKDEDMTATWNFKPNELDVDAQTNLTNSKDGIKISALSDYQYAENPSPKREDSISYPLRSLRDRLALQVNSKEPDPQFIDYVHENLNEMIKEIREISGLLRTLENTENPAIACQNIGSAYVGPENASWGYLHSKQRQSHKTLLGSVESEISSLKDVLKEHKAEDEKLVEVFQAHEVISLLKKLPVFREMEASRQQQTAQVETKEDAPQDADSHESTSEVSEITDDDDDPFQEDFGAPLISAYELDPQSYLLDYDSVADGNRLACTAEAEPLQWMSSDENKNIPNANPSHQKSKKAGDQNPQNPSANPKEDIHTYRPFKTIVVPANKPNRSMSLKACNKNATMKGSQTMKDEVHPFQDKRYNVWAELPEAESRHLMRLALRQALNNLEEGKNQ